MNLEIDSGIVRLTQLIPEYQTLALHEANEAETRKILIDRILEQVLGWRPFGDIRYEERVSEDSKTTFCDYHISTAVTHLLVEAKRVGATFLLPTNKRSASLGGVLAKGEVGDAIRQVRDYARSKSCPFAVVTNGSAWIIFAAVRTDGVPFEETEAHIFRDLADISERFVEFWDLLSRQRVIEGGLENSLISHQKEVDSRRIYSILKDPGFRLGRNAIYEHIEPAVMGALTDEALSINVEALEHCYVKSAERLKFDKRLQMHFRDAKPQLDRPVVRPRSRTGSKFLDNQLERSISRIPQFLLVLGPVGSGKTTFLQYTRNVSAAKVVNDELAWIYIDFREATLSDDPHIFIFQKLLDYCEQTPALDLGSWEKSIEPAYAETIARLKRGPLAPIFQSDVAKFETQISELVMKERDAVDPYVTKLLTHLATLRPVFLVIDNIDQIENEDYPQKIFIEAQAIARQMKLNVIMSLRDSTYLKHRSTPVFDAFQVDTMYIDAPPVGPVLTRRFQYAKTFLKDKVAEIVSDKGVRFTVEDLSVFFEIVSSSLLRDETGYMLEVLAAGDIRRGIRLVREFLSSGHTRADRVLRTFLSFGEARFFTHEVFKSCLLGQRSIYREDESILPNIFDSKLGKLDLQLMRLFILARLAKLASSATFEGLRLDLVIGDLHQMGIPEGDVLDVSSSLVETKLIRTTTGQPLSRDCSIICTRLGAYVIQVLSRRFMYIEPCTIDSAIYDDWKWEELKDLSESIEEEQGESQLNFRIKRAKSFVEYLRIIEQKWISNSTRYNLSADWAIDIVSNEIVAGLSDDCTRIVALAQRARERRAAQQS